MSEWDTLWQVVLVGAALFGMAGFFGLMIEGLSPQQHVPMSPDEEREWLRDVSGLTEEEIDEIVDGPPVH